ncbi:vanadium-dependent haloperoxidase [Anaerobacillus sp. MEB173]|uniref:vanadium-dependent haloperoxidase n=1 Tax=Anaerobacillus sp. MEB173 TaxID=3383345 RepID=UPI003F8ECF1F
MLVGVTSALRCKFVTYRVPDPPANDSQQTKNELAELEQMAANRTQSDLDIINYWVSGQKGPLTHWDDLTDDMGKLYKISPPASARIHALVSVSEAVNIATIACWNNKYDYLRPQPTDLDPNLTAAIAVPQHPAYPSGHSCVAGAASGVLKQFFPQDADVIEAKALESGFSRLLVGVHFRSDIDVGLALGRQVANDVLKVAANDQAPMRYSR